MSFRYDSPSDSAAYLLFVLLAGISEPCRITREEFEKQAKLAGILTKENQNQLMEFFFHSKNTIDFEDYWKLLHLLFLLPFSRILPISLLLSLKSFLINTLSFLLNVKSCIPIAVQIRMSHFGCIHPSNCLLFLFLSHIQ